MMPRIEDGAQAIVLAAGAGRRFGGGKLLAAFRGKPLLTWAVEAALRTRVEKVTVVLGAEADLMRPLLDDYGTARVGTVTCADWAEGLARSLVCGLDSLPSSTRAALIFLGDMPLVSPDLGNRLLAEVLNGAPAAMPVYMDKPAHPVAIAASVFPSLGALAGDRGARALLEALPRAVKVRTEDAGSVFDVDRVSDVEGRGGGGATPGNDHP